MNDDEEKENLKNEIINYINTYQSELIQFQISNSVSQEDYKKLWVNVNAL